MGEEVAKSADMTRNWADISKKISDELAFANGFTNQVMDALLDHIEVEVIDEERARLNVFLHEGIEVGKKSLFPGSGRQMSAAGEVKSDTQPSGVFVGSPLLMVKPRLLLFVTEDTYHTCRYQHRDNTTDRHGEAV